MRYVSGTKLDERVVRCDLDLGYKEGRQYGRGKSGGQVRDEHRQDYDAGRGGWGAQAQRLEIERRREVEARYQDATDGPNAVAGGGGDWKDREPAGGTKRGRSPDDEGDSRPVSILLFSSLRPILTMVCHDRPLVQEKTATRTKNKSYQIFLACIICIVINKQHQLAE